MLKFKDKASEMLYMMKLMSDFPEEAKIINKLIALQKKYEEIEKTRPISRDIIQSHYLLGATDAKSVYLNGKQWEKLLQEKSEMD